MSNKRTSARLAAGPQPASKKQKSARNAWFDLCEDELAKIWDEVVVRLRGVAGESNVCESSTRSFNNFAQVMCDELCPHVVKIVEDDGTDEDSNHEDVPDDEVDEEEFSNSDETEEEELDSDELEDDTEDEEPEDEEDDE